MDNELILLDRIEVIKQTISKVGEDKCYLSLSGGKDSTVLHYLIDESLPDNKIPRVFFDTGIEYIAVVKFVKELASHDDRFKIINSKTNIKKVLNEKGYPFKSKLHSHNVGIFNNNGITEHIYKYLNTTTSMYKCPSKLKYHFKKNNGLNFKIADYCCTEFKKKPARKYEKENKKS